MVTGKDVRGVIPALVTPFTKKDEVDLKGVERITQFLLENGVHALMPVGGTGEFPSLLREEKKDVVAAVASAAKGKVPIIPGTAACSTREVILLSNDACAAGADVVIVTAPYYFEKLPYSSLLEHYTTIAANVGCPLIVYNNPLYTGNPMSPQLNAELMNVKNIIGVKQSCTDMGQLVEMIRLSPRGRSLCTGIDSQFYPALCMGAVGVYSTAAGVIPAQMVKLYDLFQAGKHEEAQALHMQLQALNRFLEYDPGYVAPAKEALNMMGLPGGELRKPLPALTVAERTGLKAALHDVGAL